VRVRADAGGDPQLHALHGPLGDDALQQVDVGVVVDHHVADAGRDRLRKLALGLRVAVHVDAPRVEAGLQRDGQLAARGDVAGQALVAQDPQHRGARERLRGEVHLEVLAARAIGTDEGPRAGADVVLDDDVGRRAELARELDGIAAAELEVPVAGDPAAERIDVAELCADHGGAA
jgi:hypothetical protein